jgi:hypothetical protein
MIQTVVRTQNQAKMARPRDAWYGGVGVGMGPAWAGVGSGVSGVGTAVGLWVGLTLGLGEGSRVGEDVVLGEAEGFALGA